jgi:hypothetical protein
MGKTLIDEYSDEMKSIFWKCLLLSSFKSVTLSTFQNGKIRIYKTVVFHLYCMGVKHGLNKEQRLQMFEIKVLQKIFWT